MYEKLNTAKTHKALINKFNIKWYHGPEHSPQHNDLVERLVQATKTPLCKVLNTKILTETEMNTVLTDCEAASNMRPLSATSENSDDNNLLPLTPSHLILGKALTPLPRHKKLSRQKTMEVKERWKQRQHLAHQYWQLWKDEYLIQLRQLTKKYFQTRDLKK